MLEEASHITRRQRVNNSKERIGKTDDVFAKGLAAEEPSHEADDLMVQNEAQREVRTSLGGIMTAITLVNFSDWTNLVLMVSLIFGGCCANVGSIYSSYLPTGT